MPSRALLVHLQAASAMEGELEAFLNAAQVEALQESGSRAWFAFRLGSGQYGIFDACADAAECEAHLHGPIAQALRQQTQSLLSRPPELRKLEVLASKLPAPDADRALVQGLLIRFQARTGHAPQVEQILRDARRRVMREGKIPAWFALRMDANTFGVFSIFPDARTRLRQLPGAVPGRLIRHVVWRPPAFHKLDVLAHKQPG